MTRLKDLYVKEAAPALMKKFSYKSVMQIPKLEKIVINVGAGEAKENSKAIDAISGDLAKITGQKPVVCRAKKSVANFKLREGMPNGVKVTLRGDKMYEFMDREQLIFPEIDFDKIDKVRGMDICFVTTATTDEEARELLTLMGAPFGK